MHSREELKKRIQSADPDTVLACPRCAAMVKAKNMIRHYDGCRLRRSPETTQRSSVGERTRSVHPPILRTPQLSSVGPKTLESPKSQLRRSNMILRWGRIFLLVSLPLMLSMSCFQDGSGQWYDKYGHRTVEPTFLEHARPGGSDKFQVAPAHESSLAEDIVLTSGLSFFAVGIVLVSVGGGMFRVAAGRWPSAKQLFPWA